jgi:hypothetical protein
MRMVLQNYGDCVIYTERPFGYRRYIVEWEDHNELFSGLWYKEKDVIEHVERRLFFAKGDDYDRMAN